jgi:hypothetical protein
MTLSIMTLSIRIDAKCHYAECCVYLIVVLSVVMLNVVMVIVNTINVVAPEKGHNVETAPFKIF